MDINKTIYPCVIVDLMGDSILLSLILSGYLLATYPGHWNRTRTHFTFPDVPLASSSICVKFKYHMHGPDDDAQLTLEQTNDTHAHILWVQYGGMARNYWAKAEVSG